VIKRKDACAESKAKA